MHTDESPKVVFRPTDVPLIESPPATILNSPMVTEETCGSHNFCAGFVWAKPGIIGHEHSHPGYEELYYIFQGTGRVVVADVPHPVEPGAVVLIPRDTRHHLEVDDGSHLGIFWALPRKWSDLPDIQETLAAWQEVDRTTAFDT